MRYLLEPVAESYDEGPEIVHQLKELQDSFGDVHDVHVFTGTLADALAEATQIDLRSEQPGREPLVPGLSAVENALQERGAKAYQTARKSWLGNKPAGFFRSLKKIGEAIGSETTQNQEIERKFLLNGLPAFDRPDSIAEIEQGYLPGKRVIERLRRVRDENKEELLRTIKEGTGMTRLEVEEPLPAELFEQLWPRPPG